MIAQMGEYLVDLSDNGIPVMDQDDLLHEMGRSDMLKVRCPFWMTMRYQTRMRQKLWEHIKNDS